ncbi:hypothetical protein LguiA_011042 [Lonicera macranthoides]
MRGPSQVKRDFLEKWAKGLQIYSSSKKEMSIMERKKAIKLSADIAMASTRNGASSWSLALIQKAANINDTNKFLVEQLMGNSYNYESRLMLKKGGSFDQLLVVQSKRIRSKKILKKSCSVKKMGRKIISARSIAKKLVEKRTHVLKRLVPGGELMDEYSLIRETLDYIASLRVQVDVMRRIADASEVLNNCTYV